MQIATLVQVLDQPHVAAEHLHGWGVRDVRRGQQTLGELAEAGLTLDLLARVCEQLAEHLPRAPDPDAALDAFGRYFFAARSPLALAALLERDLSAMPTLLAALSLGPRWAELLIGDPEAFDLLRQAGGQAIDRAALVGEVLSEIDALDDERLIMAALARTRRRHLLRIAFGDVIGRQPLDVVLEHLSQLVEALVEAAHAAALRMAREATANVNRSMSAHVSSCVIALGQLGAAQINYALSVELLLVYDAAGDEQAARKALHEQMDSAARTTLRLLRDAGNHQSPGEVQAIGLPDSQSSAVAHAVDDVVVGFDSFGRTWHRQQMLKARAVAGDRPLGEAVLARLASWLYRRYLSRADETGIKALKRRIVVDATLRQDDWRNVRRGRGGLGDIEVTVELLQLLTGGDQTVARRRSTLAALAGLAQAGTITEAEHQALADSYRFFRALEHRLQIFTDPAITELREDDRLNSRIAASLGLPIDAAALAATIRQRLDSTWQVLHKLLASAFPEEPPHEREVELLLHPAPQPDEVRAALSPFGFRESTEALSTLNDLAREQVPFLSTRRCRHLLATILPQLLCAVGATPNPDRTLDNLARVSNSLGGKGVLWDLFRFNPPSLALYVKLCAASPYLSDLLTTNPGMIDELIDSLQLDKLPGRAELAATLTELCRGAADTLPILHDFKNAAHLRIGVRDILGKEDVDRTHEALADVAETCLAHVAELEYGRLVEKHGVPRFGPGPFEGEICNVVIVGLGKLGGREPNYHSPLEVLFLYEAEGTTRPVERWYRTEKTANNHFFTQLAQRIVKQQSQLTPKGRLYAIDALLRPIGVGGALALSLDDFAQHFATGAAPLWQWQVLCRARPVFGDSAVCQAAANRIRQLLVDRPWRDGDAAEIRRHREQLQQGAAPHNLKRATGGTLDIEFIVQMLQLRHAGASPAVLSTNTQQALAQLTAAGALPRAMAEQLGDSYRFLRRVESALQLMGAAARHDLPADEQSLQQLALLLGHSNPQRMREQCLALMSENFVAFDRLTQSS